MKRISSQIMQNMGFLFSMILFLLFVLCSVFTILIGSRVYQNIRGRNDQSFYSGTALGYITNKVRQSDAAGCVEVRTVDGIQVLVLTSLNETVVYETWIYTKDGSLMELFTERDSGLSTGDGLPVMNCSPIGLCLENTGGRPLLTVTLHGDSGRTSAALSLRSRREGGVSYE